MPSGPSLRQYNDGKLKTLSKFGIMVVAGRWIRQATSPPSSHLVARARARQRLKRVSAARGGTPRRSHRGSTEYGGRRICIPSASAAIESVETKGGFVGESADGLDISWELVSIEDKLTQRVLLGALEWMSEKTGDENAWKIDLMYQETKERTQKG